jgi:hypothetical protein
LSTNFRNKIDIFIKLSFDRRLENTQNMYQQTFFVGILSKFLPSAIFKILQMKPSRLGMDFDPLAGIIHKQHSCGILPHNREKRQDAAATFYVFE